MTSSKSCFSLSVSASNLLRRCLPLNFSLSLLSSNSNKTPEVSTFLSREEPSEDLLRDIIPRHSGEYMNLKVNISHTASVTRPGNSPPTLCRVSQQASHWSPQEGGGPQVARSPSRPARRQSWPGLHQYRGVQAEYDQQEVEHPARNNIAHHCRQLLILSVLVAATLVMTESRCPHHSSQV